MLSPPLRLSTSAPDVATAGPAKIKRGSTCFSRGFSRGTSRIGLKTPWVGGSTHGMLCVCNKNQMWLDTSTTKGITTQIFIKKASFSCVCVCCLLLAVVEPTLCVRHTTLGQHPPVLFLFLSYLWSVQRMATLLPLLANRAARINRLCSNAARNFSWKINSI